MPEIRNGLSRAHLKIAHTGDSDLFVVVKTDGTILEVNSVFETVIGRTQAELMNRSLLDFVHPEDIARTAKAFEGLALGEIDILPNFENRYLHTNGSIRWILWSGVSLGADDLLCGYGRDITELKATERSFRTMQTTAKIGTWRLNVGTMDAEWSDETYAIHEVPVGSTSTFAETALSFYAPEAQTTIRQALDECIRHGKSYDLELPFIAANGKPKWVRTIGHPVHFDGKVIELYGVFQDVTALKVQQLEIEQQRATLIENAKLSAIGQMAAGIAHEINNPLAVIHARVQLLMKRSENGTKEFETILGNCRRIEKIIRGMTTLSRSADGEPLERFNAAGWMEEIVDLCLERLRQRKIDLHVSITPDLKIYGQAIPLSQIVLNLLNNSFDAVRDLSERWVRVTATEQDGFTEIRVTDSGRPITEDLREKIFAPFFTTKPTGEGTGLGLAIAHAIARDHGGELVCSPEEGHMSFLLKIPQMTHRVAWVEKTISEAQSFQ